MELNLDAVATTEKINVRPTNSTWSAVQVARLLEAAAIPFSASPTCASVGAAIQRFILLRFGEGLLPSKACDDSFIFFLKVILYSGVKSFLVLGRLSS